jgi:hypothetical protein
MAVAGKPSFNCATAKRKVEKAICANPRTRQSRPRDQRPEHQRWSIRDADSPRAGRALQREQDAFHRPPQCRVRPAGLRSAQGDARAAGHLLAASGIEGPRDPLAECRSVFGLNLPPLPVTMQRRKANDCPRSVMAGLVPAIHVLPGEAMDVDARHKAGHDDRWVRERRHEHPDNSRYHEVHARSLSRSRGLLGRGGARDRLDRAGEKDLRSLDGPYGRWFAGAVVNTCYNALDRHVAGGRADQVALIHDSPLGPTPSPNSPMPRC